MIIENEGIKRGSNYSDLKFNHPNEREALERIRSHKIPSNYGLSALDVDRINRTTPKLTGEERKLERMYERPVNDKDLWKRIVR